MQQPEVNLTDKTVSIIKERGHALNKIVGPRVGDYVDFPDGHRERIAHDHDYFEAVQTAVGGSYYLGSGGYVEFSGALRPMILKKYLRLKPEDFALAYYWVFQDGMPRAGNGVDFALATRVWKYNPTKEA